MPKTLHIGEVREEDKLHGHNCTATVRHPLAYFFPLSTNGSWFFYSNRSRLCLTRGPQAAIVAPHGHNLYLHFAHSGFQVVALFAPWCNPCQHLARLMLRLMSMPWTNGVCWKAVLYKPDEKGHDSPKPKTTIPSKHPSHACACMCAHTLAYSGVILDSHYETLVF